MLNWIGIFPKKKSNAPLYYKEREVFDSIDYQM